MSDMLDVTSLSKLTKRKHVKGPTKLKNASAQWAHDMLYFSLIAASIEAWHAYFILMAALL